MAIVIQVKDQIGGRMAVRRIERLTLTGLRVGQEDSVKMRNVEWLVFDHTQISLSGCE